MLCNRLSNDLYTVLFDTPSNNISIMLLKGLVLSFRTLKGLVSFSILFICDCLSLLVGISPNDHFRYSTRIVRDVDPVGIGQNLVTHASWISAVRL